MDNAALSLADRPAETGSMPLHYQLYSLFVRRLEQGDWQMGDQVPTIDALVAEYRVSRATVREALGRLEREGVIRRSRGKGTYVTQDLSRDKRLVMPSNWEELVNHIAQLHARVESLNEGFVSEPGPAILYGTPADSYWSATRVNQSEAGETYSLTTILLERSIFERNADRYRGGAVLPVLAQDEQVELAEARQSLKISTADLTAARHLRLEVGAPVALVSRIAINRDGRVIYLSEVTYPARGLSLETKLY